MGDWNTPLKPAELAESRLVEAILDGHFPVGSNLPAERELAEKLGVTRPTLREALQRLSRDGWIEIQQGKPTRIRNYWLEGNLLILSAMVRYARSLPENFTPNLLQIRKLLAPEYTRLAIQNKFTDVLRLLESMQQVPDSAEDFTRVDLNFHIRMTILSGNPVFTLIFNGFTGLYEVMGMQYFSRVETRNHSRSFYRKLLMSVTAHDDFMAEEVTRRVMAESIDLWHTLAAGDHNSNIQE